MVNDLFRGVAEEGRGNPGTADGTQYHDTGIKMRSQIRNDLFRQPFFYVGKLLINAEFLAQRLHCQQVLATNGVVVHARVKIRQFNGDVNRCYRVSANQMDFGMVNLLG